ncbi:cupin [Fonsecaea pedrosoi]|nr:cupin [Fonsecaea pedrosoi]
MSYSDLSIKKQDPNAINPKSIFANNARTGASSTPGKAMGTFTGDVWLDSVLRADNISVANVNFTPCARTNWHRHDGGQLLKITGGSGWICDRGSEPRRITVGDVVWCPPGAIHWHGADGASFMVHEAVSYGKIDWYEPVKDEEYAAKK